VQAVLATLAEAVLATLPEVVHARTTHADVVLARTTPLVAAQVPPPTPPDEEARVPPQAMRHLVESREPTPTHVGC
jgi:hypothetical protein